MYSLKNSAKVTSDLHGKTILASQLKKGCTNLQCKVQTLYTKKEGLGKNYSTVLLTIQILL